MAFTYFMRDYNTLELAVEHVLPVIMGRSRARIWDAGCAMGQEPYSLAIAFAEKMGKFGFKNLYIMATDLDEQDAFGVIVESGVYHHEEVKRVPEDIFGKYFVSAQRAEHFQVIDDVRRQVAFQKHDLLSLRPIGDGFSLIVCKNVLLHFQPAERLEVIRMFHRVLATGGFLATEQTQKMPEELQHLFVQVTPDAQVFRKVDKG